MKQKVICLPIGHMLLSADEGALCEVRLLKEDTGHMDEDPVLDEAQRQLWQYFAGERRIFDLPLCPKGSAFDQAVWQKLKEIPFGEIAAYGQIAAALGKRGAARAVGSACARNPLLIVVPCHRVVAGTGRLTGFAAGMQAKRMLLELEGWQTCGDRIRIR